ncbi:hypothetical protein P8843_17175 [Bacillus inaquosorum]|uniref:hypothetical protein n=1 Tax=Bacillus inaquosorum TaxID=483913 RepID=UPI00227F1DC9|nr:hypothetical protein [Bacillus inaquosorum]MCY7974624.1 hypothetical protein [Bacillus inaquosorum]MEC0545736.1 hypothetical protein [Bacillus inaquosorum]MEC0591951.1 hypothetical protein [Bacillus inaquosorum]
MYQIQKVKNMFGIPSSTQRFYEKEGILPKNSRMQAVIVLPVPDKIHVIRVRSDEVPKKNISSGLFVKYR